MTLIKGDCIEELKKLPDKSVDLVLTDPPYEFIVGGGSGCFGTNKRNYREECLALYKETGKTKETERLKMCAIADEHRGQTRFISKGFDFTFLDECCRILKKINIYVWCSKAQVNKLLNYFNDKNCNIDILTWHKTNCIPTCNNTYLNDTEYLIFAREKGVKIYGSYQTKHKYYVTQINVKDKKKYKHPTIKPLFIIKNLIENSTTGGAVVLDPYMGSGTTGVACKALGRDFIGIEINDEFFEIAKNRIAEPIAEEQAEEEPAPMQADVQNCEQLGFNLEEMGQN